LCDAIVFVDHFIEPISGNAAGYTAMLQCHMNDSLADCQYQYLLIEMSRLLGSSIKAGIDSKLYHRVNSFIAGGNFAQLPDFQALL
jgi:hypothetical protein